MGGADADVMLLRIDVIGQEGTRHLVTRLRDAGYASGPAVPPTLVDLAPPIPNLPMMRAPQRKRPRKRVICVPPDINLYGVSERATYVGSPEHKDAPSFAGQPRLRADASCCPREITDRILVTGWLRAAIRRGATGAPWEGGFPRYVWYKDGGTVYEGRLVNRGRGTYKGYPLGDDEWPDGIESIHAEA